MTKKKDLKRRVRERQAKTGKSYTGGIVAVGRRRPLMVLGLLDDVQGWPQLSLMGIGR